MAESIEQSREAPNWPRRRHHEMALLALAVAAGTYARAALGPIQEAVRVSLLLSDNHLALLQGPALALPLLIASVPLGLFIDRGSRVRLLAALAILNVVGTAATALSDGFLLLFASRCLIGLTAVAVNPVALSLIADLYPPAARGRAHTIVSIGQVAGMSGAFAIGGSLLAALGGNEAWRAAIGWMVVPLGIVVLTTLLMREPPRSGVLQARPGWRDARAELARYRGVVLPLGLGVVVIEIGIGAALVWTVPTLARAFALAPDHIGAIMSLGLFVGGLAGPVFGGLLADLCQARGGPRRTMALLALVAGLSIGAGLFPLAPSPMLFGAGLIVFVTLIMAVIVIATTLFTLAIPNELRGMCMSVLAALCVLFGNGFAPPATSLLSGPLGGESAIGLALAIVCVASSLSALVIFAAGIRNFPREAY